MQCQEKKKNKVCTCFLKSERQTQKLEINSLEQGILKKIKTYLENRIVCHHCINFGGITEAALEMHRHKNKILIYL